MKPKQYIKQVRKELGLSQSEMGDKLHVTGRTVLNWENGQEISYITLMVYERFADDAGLDIEKPNAIR